MNRRISRRDTLRLTGASLVASSGAAGDESDAFAEQTTQPTSYAAPPDQLASLPFGTRSHWLQPWRFGDTTRASAVRSGLGAVVEDIALPANPQAIATLSRASIRTVRIEIGWGHVDYETESHFRNIDQIHRVIEACARERSTSHSAQRAPRPPRPRRP